ncbi:hypothetical protein EJB05_13002 [Eragrostis curvula]|uniref:Uncharacterized protein n=1 Tax=Eragrostis curvula TaxID=38414 RepID=A0A5J9VVC5_9POAL|nr:hypothetical protein EJB05_13002 [Eragrostis curvula]
MSVSNLPQSSSSVKVSVIRVNTVFNNYRHFVMFGFVPPEHGMLENFVDLGLICFTTRGGDGTRANAGLVLLWVRQLQPCIWAELPVLPVGGLMAGRAPCVVFGKYRSHAVLLLLRRGQQVQGGDGTRTNAGMVLLWGWQLHPCIWVEAPVLPESGLMTGWAMSVVFINKCRYHDPRVPSRPKDRVT